MMSSRGHKKTKLHEKLQLLRSVTNSHALSSSSIIVDASKYIKDLKQKVKILNQEIACIRMVEESSLPVVNVKTLEKGFLINVYSEKSSQGLLVSVLETFEELGLNAIEARVSCTDTFHLEAVGENLVENLDAQVVKQAVLQAIKDCSESSGQD
ncbi:Myc-type basic helix-loop-helix (bHLH) domain-containing protein [Dioscorea alata]|uniref:Myc-type basic helix-loop-helix (BHLH) domain-containing protein n=1 Tax=Dioscorea alata TaxID=55571 RepID=A0ACB7VTK9_DIOAL|nr:Myc-type basic helix-loop-helix (bHLH) domain-containing protein [Dioscorea alata]